MKNTFKIVRWIGQDTWVNTESSEIEIKTGDLILHEGSKITTGFMSAFLREDSKDSFIQNIELVKYVSSDNEYQKIYQEDLQKRFNDAPVITIVEDEKGSLKSQKAKDIASKFGVSFGK